MTDNRGDARALPQADRAVAPMASSPSVSPVPASIPSADEAVARKLLSTEYNDPYTGHEGPYPTYADLARSGKGAFTLCSIRAVMRGIEYGRASAIEARSGETAQQARSGTDESAVPTADAQPEVATKDTQHA